jgi:ATP-dependent phosphoenolpyruvate carboxykinase
MEHPQLCRPEKEESNNMSEAKPKIEGAKKFSRPARAAGLTEKEFVTKVLGLESHTFNIGNAKYAAKYKKTVDAIANLIQRKYKKRGRHCKGNQGTKPSNPKSSRVPNSKGWGDRCRPRGDIPLATGRCCGVETNCPT